ncbi:3262_t:CDS:2 [Diversispora eburnea]|uniref:3262_t:CDS:1 n=1 Tax=Diversispora eburnea TaxID=1213867 RepID=A0A9N8V0Z3_9GLOM|nr:3262_t:CDS:2 [Diversispora eburnea]
MTPTLRLSPDIPDSSSLPLNFEPKFYPPVVSVKDFPLKSICSRSPNSFFVYRKAFWLILHSHGYNIPMLKASKLLSKFWKEETTEVKEAYARISREVKREHEKLKRGKIWEINYKKDDHESGQYITRFSLPSLLRQDIRHDNNINDNYDSMTKIKLSGTISTVKFSVE